MGTSKRWVVTTSGDISKVKKKLSESGFTIDQVLEEIGAVTGTAGEDVVEKLRDIPGVADVSPEVPIDIGPPDAPGTW